MEKLSERASVNHLIEEVSAILEKKNMPGADVFARCFKDTLDKTIKWSEDGSVFVITGDIPAMWLRDSTCQMRPYLMLAKEDTAIAAMIEGVIRRQVSSILIDPYANAFNETANGNCWAHDETDMKPELWERKYEIDSLCFPVQLAWLYWKNTGCAKHFDADFLAAAKLICRVFRTEQDHENQSSYTFQRHDTFFTDTLSRNGKGALVKSNTGLIWSGFRPSDDACVYGYLIPSNMLASVILGYISEIAREVYHDEALSMSAKAFSEEVRAAIEKEATLYDYRRQHPYYSYEVDGFGQYLIMDDANLPSLLSMPYIGYCAPDDPKYLNTRKIICSQANPYYYEGKALRGIGSMHTPANFVWHISIGMEGLTSGDESVMRECILRMLETDGGTGCMHEGINVDDPAVFTRPWFSWANMVFCELVLNYCGFSVAVK